MEVCLGFVLCTAIGQCCCIVRGCIVVRSAYFRFSNNLREAVPGTEAAEDPVPCCTWGLGSSPAPGQPNNAAPKVFVPVRPVGSRLGWSRLFTELLEEMHLGFDVEPLVPLLQ